MLKKWDQIIFLTQDSNNKGWMDTVLRSKKNKAKMLIYQYIFY